MRSVDRDWSGVRQNGRIAVLDREAARRLRDMDVPNQSLRARHFPLKNIFLAELLRDSITT